MLALLEILGFMLEFLFGIAELAGGWMELRDRRHATRLGAGLSAQRKRELSTRIKHSEELQHLLHEQQRRQAIQLYRAETGASTKEARIAVHMLANKILADRYAAQLVQRDETALAEIHAFLQQGKRHKAVQIYRATTGAGLLEGAAAVNVLELEWGLQQRV